MEEQIAFIDEFGNNGFDFEKEGVSTTFIVTAIIVDHSKLPEIEGAIEKIRKIEFQKSEMKSSGVGQNDGKRLRILKKLNHVDFHIFSCVVDKKKLNGPGFAFKGSFYKFLHNIVDRELFRTFPNLMIVSDEHGSKEFREGFQKYILGKHQPDLFDQREFRITNSKSELCVQLADLISGTLARCFEENKLSDRRSEMMKVMQNKITFIHFWPSKPSKSSINKKNDFFLYDPIIAKVSLRYTDQYIKENRTLDTPVVRDRVMLLQFLRLYFTQVNPEEYISTKELMEHINSHRVQNCSMHYFRSKIIARLRDEGVLIASSNKGYKLPANQSDLMSFVQHIKSYVDPMIGRIMKCRNSIKLATKNEVDILSDEDLGFVHHLRDIETR